MAAGAADVAQRRRPQLLRVEREPKSSFWSRAGGQDRAMAGRVASVKRALLAHCERIGATMPPRLLAALAERFAEEYIQEATPEDLGAAHEQLDKQEKVSDGESKQMRKAWAVASCGARCRSRSCWCGIERPPALLRKTSSTRSLSPCERAPLADAACEGEASTPRRSPPSAAKAPEASAEPPPSPPSVVRRFYSHYRQSVCAQLSTGEIRAATEHRTDEGKMSGLIEPFGWLTTSEPAEIPASPGPSCFVAWTPRRQPERGASKRGAWCFEHCAKRSCVVARCLQKGKGSSRTFSYAKYGGAEGAELAADDFCEELYESSEGCN